MYGLGDNIYQRAVVRALGPSYLFTPWPEIYEDLPVQFLNGATTLRTQRKNITAQPPTRWTYLPGRSRAVRVAYGSAEFLAGRTILAAMERAVGVDLGPRPVFDLPDLGPGSPLRPRAPYVVVRPATVRQEWRAEARNPRPEYLAQICAWLREDGYLVVSVADLDGLKEFLIGEAPPADLTFHRGELRVRDLLALVRDSAGAVGGVGWILPACMALRRPLLCVAGGLGAHNAPELLCDPRLPSDTIAWAMPDRYCRCVDSHHRCDKEISDLRSHYEAWRDLQLSR